jgi:hypothetical protein
VRFGFLPGFFVNRGTAGFPFEAKESLSFPLMTLSSFSVELISFMPAKKSS